jgi:hypothetical protein
MKTIKTKGNQVFNVPNDCGWSFSMKINPQMFCCGYCPEFALALHQTFNWPIYIFNEIQEDDDDYFGVLIHATVKTPDGRFADVRGIRTEHEIAKNLMGSSWKQVDKYEVVAYTKIDLENEQIINPEVLAIAYEYISKNKNKWKCK